jgi:3-oxoacyl-[acyl-carrier-protein] synthase-3
MTNANARQSVWLLATGSYVPARIVANSDFLQFPPASLPLIAEKTGILERHFAADGECTSDLAVAAARKCLERAGMNAAELDGIVLATSSPDRIQPATATRVQALLGAKQAFAFDVNSVCSGALYAAGIAASMIEACRYNTVLVLASEIYSRLTNPRDFSTHPYFGDGAGAMLFSSARKSRLRVADFSLHADGAGADVISVPAGGSMLPFQKVQDPKDLYFRMNGREVYDFAVREGTNAILALIRRNSLSCESISQVVCHQANINIIRALASATEIPLSKFFVNLDRFGNTAAASVLLALDGALDGADPPQANSHIVLAAFGGGLSWGSLLIQVV